ncbi:AAA family ATPase [Paenibacillus sp. HJL G12]|uniref:AAA family ATPase n=2 Tax=Paenibacillus dendrobii TaxID=2691084 RepID=A0A7X3IIN5_9BACL|nr:AAA family ATPase [Paenibacillus dendrobii]
MLTYKVVLAVKEPQYLEALLHYVHASEFGDRLRIIGFTRTESFLEYMSGDERPDLVVGDGELLEPWLRNEEAACPWKRLGSGGDPAAELAKYQPLPELLGAVLQACQKDGSRARIAEQRGEGALTIGFVSAVGGSGKTTAAVNMAKQLGGMGLSVFYLNLEALNSSAVFSRQNRKAEDAQRLPQLLYEMKAAAEMKSSEAIPLESFVVSHPAMKCDWFEPVHNRNEILQLGKADVLRLMDMLSRSGSYDVVIVDTDSGLNERTAAVMEGCRHLVWILLDDLIHMFKSGQQLSYLERGNPGNFAEWCAKSRFIVNRFVGELANPLPEAIPNIDGVLPYIPSWKQSSNEELLLSSPIFQRDILKLCRELLGDDLPGGSGVRAYG